MRVLKLTLFFMLITGAIIIAGKWLPHLFIPHSAKSLNSIDSLGQTDSVAMLKDSTKGKWASKLAFPLIRAYKLNPKTLHKRYSFWELALPKGKPIHEYALELEKLCRSKQIKVIKGVELLPRDKQVEYTLESEGDTLRLRLNLNQNVLAGSAKLAIVWVGLDSLSPAQREALIESPWEKTLLLNALEDAIKDWNPLPEQNEIFLELPMEPSNYAQAHNIQAGLFIHHNEKEINKTLDQLLDVVPKAKGFGSKWGDRAVENQPLLEKFFAYIAPRHLVFLDLTGSQRSLVGSLAGAHGAFCKVTPVFRDSLHLEAELNKKIITAQKNGDAILVIAYSPFVARSFSQWLQTNKNDLQAKGLELVKVSSLF